MTARDTTTSSSHRPGRRPITSRRPARSTRCWPMTRGRRRSNAAQGPGTGRGDGAARDARGSRHRRRRRVDRRRTRGRRDDCRGAVAAAAGDPGRDADHQRQQHLGDGAEGDRVPGKGPGHAHSRTAGHHGEADGMGCSDRRRQPGRRIRPVGRQQADMCCHPRRAPARLGRAMRSVRACRSRASRAERCPTSSPTAHWRGSCTARPAR